MTFRLANFYLTLISLALSEARHKSYAVDHRARDGQFPYMALIFDGRHAHCGASIIHERWALTAAHCLSDYSTTIKVGAVDSSPSVGTHYKVEKIFVRSDYEVTPEDERFGLEYIANNIGLIRLTKNIRFNNQLHPIKLATDEEDSYENSTATIPGWRTIQWNGKEHLQNLRYMSVRVLTPEECRRVWTYADDKYFCTTNQKHRGMCHEDSSSPVVIDGRQIGIVSISDDNCQSTKPNLHTKVASFIPWINDTMSQYGDVLPAYFDQTIPLQ